MEEEFQPAMEQLFAAIERGEERAAVAQAQAWFAKVDAGLIAAIERALAAQALDSPTD